MTLLASFSAVEELGTIHVWESGISTNEIIKAVDTTNTNPIQFDDLTGTELEGKLTIEHSGGKLQMRALAEWDKIDSGRSAADKEVRNITYGLFSDSATFYRYGVDRFITAVEGNKWYMNTLGMVKGKTLKGTIGEVTMTMTVGQTTDYLKDMVTSAGTTMTLDGINLRIAEGMTVTVAGETRNVTAVAQNKIITLDSALTTDLTSATEATFESIGYLTVAAPSVDNHAGRMVTCLPTVNQDGADGADGIPVRKFGTNTVALHIYRTAAFRLTDKASGLENGAGANVPERTIHYNATDNNGEMMLTVDSNLRYTRDSGDGVSTPRVISNAGVTIAADGTVTIAPRSLQAAAPTTYGTSMTVTITDKNATAIAYLAGNEMNAGSGVQESSQSIKINVLPDAGIGIKADHTDTLDIFDKFLSLDDAMFKVNMNYYSDAANQARITLKTTSNASTIPDSIVNIADENAGTIVLTQGAGIASAAYAAPKTYGTDIGFLKLLDDMLALGVSKSAFLNTYQPMETEHTYTMDIEEKIRPAMIADITDNLLLTEKKVTQVVRLTRHYNPQIYQACVNPTQLNFTGRITHLRPQNQQAHWHFTEFTGKGLGTLNTGTYINRYQLEFADGQQYPATHEILSNGGSDFPQLDIEDGDFGHIQDGATLLSKIGEDEDIPTSLDGDETKIKLTLTFKCNRLDGSADTNTIVYSLSDKLTTKEHPHIKFNHRSQPKAKYVQVETEAALKDQEDLPWLVFTASNLENNAPFADFTVTGATAATTTMGTNGASATHSIGLDAGNNRLRIATTASGVVASSNGAVLTMAAEDANIVAGMSVTLSTGSSSDASVTFIVGEHAPNDYTLRFTSGGTQTDAMYTITEDANGDVPNAEGQAQIIRDAINTAEIGYTATTGTNTDGFSTVTVSSSTSNFVLSAITQNHGLNIEQGDSSLGPNPYTSVPDQTRTVTAVNGTAVTVDSALAADITANTTASFSKALPAFAEADIYKNVYVQRRLGWIRRPQGDCKRHRRLSPDPPVCTNVQDLEPRKRVYHRLHHWRRQQGAHPVRWFQDEQSTPYLSAKRHRGERGL